MEDPKFVFKLVVLFFVFVFTLMLLPLLKTVPNSSSFTVIDLQTNERYEGMDYFGGDPNSGKFIDHDGIVYNMVNYKIIFE